MRSILTTFICFFIAASWAQSAQEEFGYEYIPDASDSVIEARLQAMSVSIPMTFTPAVKSHIQYYTVRRRDYARRMLNRSSKYFPLFERKLAEHNLPDELKYLSIVESGLNPSIASHASAVGLWQFMYWTGKRYDMDSNWYIDDRMDPDKATEAACGYLKYLYGYFSDWELALAGYNSGPGRVNKAIRYSDNQRNFWAIYDRLPRETRGYLPKFIAVAYVFTYAEEHNLYADAPQYLPEYDTIQVSQYLHVETFAKESQIDLDELKAINPQIRHGAIPATAKLYGLKVPVDKKAFINENRKVIFSKATSVGRVEIEKMAANEIGAVAGRERVLYKVRSGDVLGKIAQRYHVRVADIRKWNKLKGNMIRVGQQLKVWVLPKYKNPATVKAIASKPAKPAPKPLPGQNTYVVKNGDTLWDISKANSISIEKIKVLNNLSGDGIKPGQTLIVSTK